MNTGVFSLLPVLLAQTDSQQANSGGWLAVLITLAVLVLPFVAGTYIAKSLRLQDYGWKIGLTLFAITFGISVILAGGRPKLGIDLAGGVILVYEVDQSKKVDDEPVDIDRLVGAVKRRVDPAGVKELTIRPYGSEQVEVIVPEVDNAEIELIKKKISASGLLEFRITANTIDHADIIDSAMKLTGSNSLTGPDGKTELARWVRLGKELMEEGPDGTLIPSPGLITRPSAVSGYDVLVIIDRLNVNGGYLKRATRGYDELANLAVNFTLKPDGAELFGELTGQNLPDPTTGFKRRLGIVLDGELLSAPNLNSRINGQGQIAGSFTDADVTFLVDVLNAGSLPAALNPIPISEQKISPTLGEDTIRQGKQSMILASILVLAFMVVYYRFSGVVACIVLMLNLLLVLSLMILVKAAFTLPGLAGLVLTVGMAVDANVLIYERIREELARGAALRMAIRNGFDRATSTIVDANITTLIVGVVLYTIGTDQIRGFAVTLILGILLSMFTAIFCARLMFEISERRQWISKLRMMQILTKSEFDFVKFSRPAFAISIILIVIGLGSVVSRGRTLLDIDFTGGSSVHILFTEDKPHDIKSVRDALEASTLEDVTVVSVGEGNFEFKIDTANPDPAAVEQQLEEIFSGQLRSTKMTYGEISVIPPTTTTPESLKSDVESVPDGVETSPTQSSFTPAGINNSRFPSPASPTIVRGQNESTGDESTGDEKSVDEKPGKDTLQGPPSGESASAEKEPQATPVAGTGPAVDSTPAGSTTPISDQQSADDTAEDVTPFTASPGLSSPQDALAGGTKVVITFPEGINHDALSSKISSTLQALGLPNAVFTLTNPLFVPGSSNSHQDWTLQIALDQEQTRQLVDRMKSDLAERPVFPSSSNIGSKVAGDTKLKAVYALAISLVGIILYIWLRFQNLVWGLASVVALVHDVLIILGAIAVSQYVAPLLGILLVDPFKISLTMVAAFLTVIGYSINDTIVIFDRMRDIKGKSTDLTAEMVNLSLNQTLARTFITSITVLFVVVVLYIFGGQAIHGFAFALVVGVVTGTYSSLFIAAPLVLWIIGKSQPAPPVTKAQRRAAATAEK